MQGHRLLRAFAVFILIVAIVYLALALGGSLWLGGSGFGAGWGTGWTGWLVLPLAGAAVMAGITLLVFGLMLFFLARIDNNLAAARQRPRMQSRAAAPLETVVTATPPSVEPPAPPVVSSTPVVASTAAAVSALPFVDVTSDDAAERELRVIAEEQELLRGTEEDDLAWEGEAGEVESVREISAEASTAEPPAAFGEEAGDVIVPGGVLPVVEIAEERRPSAAAEPLAGQPVQPEVTPGAGQGAVEPVAPDMQSRAVEAAPPDLILREPVQIEVEAGEPEIGLPAAELPELDAPPVPPESAPPDLILREPVQIEVEAGEHEIGLPDVEPGDLEAALPQASADEVELPRVDLSGSELQLETEDMVTPERAAPSTPTAEPPAVEARLPEIEITELAAETEPAESLSVLSDATGVPETELRSGVASEPSAETAVEPQRAAPTGLDALQAEIAALRQQLAALQAQINQPNPPPSTPSSGRAAQGDLVDPAELPDEPLAEDSSADASPSNKLPGADEVARIAAEMNALKSKPNRPAPAATPSITTTMRAPQSGSVAGEDNLEIIMGVGPIYAKRLREVGITTYQQLADASYELLEKVTRGNLERVIKEDWRGQALRLINRT